MDGRRRSNCLPPSPWSGRWLVPALALGEPLLGIPVWVPATAAAVVLSVAFAARRTRGLTPGLVPWSLVVFVCGLFLAVTTLAFAIALDEYFFNTDRFHSILPNNVDRSLLFQRFNLDFNYDMYLTCLAFLGLSILAALGVRKARSGRVVIATLDNQRAADAAAVNTTAAPSTMAPINVRTLRIICLSSGWLFLATGGW